MNESRRATGRAIAQKYLQAGDPLGWFEHLYQQAGGEAAIISWADMQPNPNLLEWLDQSGARGPGLALKVGSGLGDDAEELARRGFETTAFDISETAINWSRKRFPNSAVNYIVADLFSPPADWLGKFDFVLEAYTLQVLPPELRAEAARCISSFLAPGGLLLLIARLREPNEPEGKMPWPLTQDELSLFEEQGLKQLSFEDYSDDEYPPVRRFRAVYQRS